MFASRRRRRWSSFSDLLTNDHPRNPLTFYIICIYSCPLPPPCLPASTLTIIIIISISGDWGLGSEQERYNNANCKFSTSYRRILFPVCARLVNGQSIIPSVYSIPLADVGVRPAVLLHSMALLIALPLRIVIVRSTLIHIAASLALFPRRHILLIAATDEYYYYCYFCF